MNTSNTSSVPTQYVEFVKSALENLYDYVQLQRNPLAALLSGTKNISIESPAHILRHEILKSIEKLNPGEGFSFSSVQSRSHHLLQIHYVEGLMIQEIANELKISIRQAYRDLRHAEENLAVILFSLYPMEMHDLDINNTPAPETGIPSEEISHLIVLKEITDICQIIRAAYNTVKQLAFQYKTYIELSLPSSPILIKTDPAITQQVFINWLSSVIKASTNRSIALSLDVNKSGLDMVITIPQRQGDRFEPYPLDPFVQTLVKLLDWSIDHKNGNSPFFEYVLHIPTHESLILVIDDNEGFTQLIERYLSEYPVHVLSAGSGAEGLKMVEENSPVVIILDVMMANLDGWEVLQRIKANPMHANIPVVICSVINDSELALSLGVENFLPKPVKREEILAVLQKIGVL